MPFSLTFLRGRKSHLENKLRVTQEAAQREGLLPSHRHYKLHALIPAIERALNRLVKREYGHCLDCEEPIPTERLLRQPHAERCVPCQTRYET
jgi:RNA polymerase-binding transcription factor DksA